MRGKLESSKRRYTVGLKKV